MRAADSAMDADGRGHGFHGWARMGDGSGGADEGRGDVVLEGA